MKVVCLPQGPLHDLVGLLYGQWSILDPS